jgi:hypothetical protein
VTPPQGAQARAAARGGTGALALPLATASSRARGVPREGPMTALTTGVRRGAEGAGLVAAAAGAGGVKAAAAGAAARGGAGLHLQALLLLGNGEMPAAAEMLAFAVEAALAAAAEVLARGGEDVLLLPASQSHKSCAVPVRSAKAVSTRPARRVSSWLMLGSRQGALGETAVAELVREAAVEDEEARLAAAGGGVEAAVQAQGAESRAELTAVAPDVAPAALAEVGGVGASDSR